MSGLRVAVGNAIYKNRGLIKRTPANAHIGLDVERAALLVSLMEMDLDSVKRPEATSPPTIN